MKGSVSARSLELCDEAQSRGSSPLEGSATGAVATQLLVVTDAMLENVKRHCTLGLSNHHGCEGSLSFAQGSELSFGLDLFDPRVIP